MPEKVIFPFHYHKMDDKRLVAEKRGQVISATVVNSNMREYEEIDTQKRNLELFKYSMIHALKNGMGNRYTDAVQQRDALDKEVSQIMDSYSRLTGDYDNLLFDMDVEAGRLRNINAQRRIIVFNRNVGKKLEVNTAAYRLLTQQQQETKLKLKSMQRTQKEIESRLDQLDNLLMKKKTQSKNSFQSLGETPAKLQKKIAAVDRKITTLGHRQKQLLRQIAGQMSRVQLRATGCHADNNDQENK